MLHGAEQIGAEPALLPFGPSDHASREQAGEKFLREIPRVAEIMGRTLDVALNGRIISRAQICQRRTRVRGRALRGEHLGPACGQEVVAWGSHAFATSNSVSF